MLIDFSDVPGSGLFELQPLQAVPLVGSDVAGERQACVEAQVTDKDERLVVVVEAKVKFTEEAGG